MPKQSRSSDLWENDWVMAVQGETVGTKREVHDQGLLPLQNNSSGRALQLWLIGCAIKAKIAGVWGEII